MTDGERDALNKLIESYEAVLEYLRITTGRIDALIAQNKRQDETLMQILDRLSTGQRITPEEFISFRASVDEARRGYGTQVVWPVLPGDDE